MKADGYLLLPLREGVLAARPRVLWGWPKVERLLASSARGLGCAWEKPRLLMPGVAVVRPVGAGPVFWLLLSCGSVFRGQSPGIRPEKAA